MIVDLIDDVRPNPAISKSEPINVYQYEKGPQGKKVELNTNVEEFKFLYPNNTATS